MKRVAVSAFFMALLFVTGFAQADGHAALEEENAKLQEMIVTLSEDRKHLSARLRRAIAYSKANRGELESAVEERDTLRGRLRRAIAYSKANRGELESAVEERDTLRGRLRRAIANAKATKGELESQLAATAPSDWASGMGASLQSSIGGLQGTKVITSADNTVKVQVGNNGLFQTGGTSLSGNGVSLLGQIAQQLAQQNAMVTVIGHSDNIPVGENSRFGSNEELSFARATSTMEFLLREGVPVERLSAAGYGAGDPIASNDTPEGRQQNRRVDIVLRAR